MLKRTICLATMLGLLGACPLPALAADVEEDEVPESAVSSPPMEMDDPGTPGKRGVEVNFVGTFIRSGIGRTSETLLDANFGIGDRIQLKYERPYLTEGEVGTPSQKGLGATEFGIKWRAVDHGGLALAFYPQYSMDDAFTLKAEDGTPEESEGRSFYVPMLVSKEVHHLYTLAANVGFRRNLEGHGDDATMALGLGRAVGGDGRVLGEVFSERDTHLHNRQTDVRLGYVITLFPKALAESSFEFPVYASVGHSIGRTEANELSTSISFGVSAIKKPGS